MFRPMRTENTHLHSDVSRVNPRSPLRYSSPTAWLSSSPTAWLRGTMTDAVWGHLSPLERLTVDVCSADGLTHTESNKLYRKVKHRYRPNLSPHELPALTALAQHTSHSHSGIDEKRPTVKFVARHSSDMLNQST